MKWVNVIILVILVSNPCFTQIGGRTKVAVMTLESSGIDQSALISLTDRFRSELINTGRFDVMERGKMDEILREQGFQQSGACNTNECLVQAGKMLGVARMIAGSVGRVGKIYTVSARVIDIEIGRVLISKTEDCDCPVEKVLTESMRNLAQKVVGLTPGSGDDIPRTQRIQTCGAETKTRYRWNQGHHPTL